MKTYSEVKYIIHDICQLFDSRLADFFLLIELHVAETRLDTHLDEIQFTENHVAKHSLDENVDEPDLNENPHLI